MKKLYIIILSICTGLMSCTKDSNELSGGQFPTTDLPVKSISYSEKGTASDELGSLKSSYKRYGAPVYLSGVKFSVRHESESDYSYQEFNFNPAGEQEADKDIILKQIKLGCNWIYSEGICSGSYHNSTLTLTGDQIVPASITDVDARADAYAPIINTLDPVYAKFRGNSDQIMVKEVAGNEDYTAVMHTNDKRLNLVIENNIASKYTLGIQVHKPENKGLMYGLRSNVAAGEVKAAVINESSLSQYDELVVKIWYKTNYGDVKEESYTITFPDKKVTTHVIKMDRTGYLSGDTNSQITFEAGETENNEGTVIGDPVV